METIKYKTEVFEGPMDLLLHLITKHKLNIYDIPIAELVDQYSAYIRQMQEADMDIASEFLETAARLVHIKSLSLLPVYEEAEVLKRELSGELIEYAECKRVAESLSGRTEGFDSIPRPQEKTEGDNSYTRTHDPLELLNAYMRVVGKRLKLIPPPVDVFRPIVAKKIVSVSAKIKSVCEMLSRAGKRGLNDIFRSSESRSDMVAAFLAVLELVKTRYIHIDGDGDKMTVTLIKMPEGEIDFD